MFTFKHNADGTKNWRLANKSKKKIVFSNINVKKSQSHFCWTDKNKHCVLEILLKITFIRYIN